MSPTACIAPTEINGVTDIYDPDRDHTVRVWQLLEILRKLDPMRPVQISATMSGAPLLLDIIKISDGVGYLQIVAE